MGLSGNLLSGAVRRNITEVQRFIPYVEGDSRVSGRHLIIVTDVITYYDQGFDPCDDLPFPGLSVPYPDVLVADLISVGVEDIEIPPNFYYGILFGFDGVLNVDTILSFRVSQLACRLRPYQTKIAPHFA